MSWSARERLTEAGAGTRRTKAGDSDRQEFSALRRILVRDERGVSMIDGWSCHGVDDFRTDHREDLQNEFGAATYEGTTTRRVLNDGCPPHAGPPRDWRDHGLALTTSPQKGAG